MVPAYFLSRQGFRRSAKWLTRLNHLYAEGPGSAEHGVAHRSVEVIDEGDGDVLWQRTRVCVARRSLSPRCVACRLLAPHWRAGGARALADC